MFSLLSKRFYLCTSYHYLIQKTTTIKKRTKIRYNTTNFFNIIVIYGQCVNSLMLQGCRKGNKNGTIQVGQWVYSGYSENVTA